MQELQKFERFLYLNMKIKQLMINCSPEHNIVATNEDAIKYSDKLYTSINEIKQYFNDIADLFPNVIDNLDFIDNLFNIFLQKIVDYGNDYEKLKKFYCICISDLSQKVKDVVGTTCIGYTIQNSDLIEHAKTINELLHIIHQSIINNEEMYQNMPLLSKKINNFDETISLYGRPSAISDNLFNSIPSNLYIGETEILSINDDRMFMMIRDRGHALTIEIQKEKEIYLVRYFIPKICNDNMVNNLKGVRKVTKNDKYTTGVYEITKDELSSSVINLIENVPTDEHSVIPGGRFYNEELAKRIGR